MARYYETAESFLFFASQSLFSTTDAHLHGELAPLLGERILGRAGAGLAWMAVGVHLERGLSELLPLQCEVGGWSLSWAYRYGKSGIN